MEQEPLLLETKSHPPSSHWQISLAFFAFLLMGANGGAIGVPYIGAHYAVDKATVSWLFLCSSSGYLIC